MSNVPTIGSVVDKLAELIDSQKLLDNIDRLSTPIQSSEFPRKEQIRTEPMSHSWTPLACSGETIRSSGDASYKGDNNIFHGDRLIVVGNFNTIHGNNCVVYGNGNVLTGNNCNSFGNDNVLRGSGGSVEGNGNVYQSSSTLNKGGIGNRLATPAPQRGTIHIPAPFAKKADPPATPAPQHDTIYVDAPLTKNACGHDYSLNSGRFMSRGGSLMTCEERPQPTYPDYGTIIVPGNNTRGGIQGPTGSNGCVGNSGSSGCQGNIVPPVYVSPGVTGTGWVNRTSFPSGYGSDIEGINLPNNKILTLMGVQVQQCTRNSYSVVLEWDGHRLFLSSESVILDRTINIDTDVLFSNFSATDYLRVRWQEFLQVLPIAQPSIAPSPFVAAPAHPLLPSKAAPQSNATSPFVTAPTVRVLPSKAVVPPISLGARIQGQDAEADDDDKACCICLVNQKCCSILSCGHRCLCIGCANRCIDEKMKNCPVCKGPVERIARIFD